MRAERYRNSNLRREIQLLLLFFYTLTPLSKLGSSFSTTTAGVVAVVVTVGSSGDGFVVADVDVVRHDDRYGIRGMMRCDPLLL